MDPSPDEEDFNKWYNEEHIPMVAKMPGYYYGLRYENTAAEATKAKRMSQYLTIHGVEDLNGFASPEARASGDTVWTKKHVGQMKGLRMRGWKLILM